MALELKYQIVLVRPDGTRDVFRKTIQDRFGAYRIAKDAEYVMRKVDPRGFRGSKIVIEKIRCR